MSDAAGPFSVHVGDKRIPVFVFDAQKVFAAATVHLRNAAGSGWGPAKALLDGIHQRGAISLPRQRIRFPQGPRGGYRRDGVRRRGDPGPRAPQARARGQRCRVLVARTRRIISFVRLQIQSILRPT